MFRWILRLFVGCKHNWKLLDKVEMPSIADRARDNGFFLKSIWPGAHVRVSSSVFACSICGKLRRIKTVSEAF